MAILGEIATFTIPKVLHAQQDQKYKAIAKEDIAMMSAAFQQAQTAGTVSSSTKTADLTPYMNYMQINTTLTIDHVHNWGPSATCNASNPCLVLHNGSVIWLYSASFVGTASTNAIFFYIDPDGRYTSTSTTGPGKSLEVFIYYNGRISTRGNIVPNTVSSDATRGPDSSHEPPWFSW